MSADGILIAAVLVSVVVASLLEAFRPRPQTERDRLRALGGEDAVLFAAAFRSGMMPLSPYPEVSMQSRNPAAASGLVLSADDRRVLDELGAAGAQGIAPADLAEQLNMPTGTLQSSLLRLRGAGQAEAVGDKWRSRRA